MIPKLLIRAEHFGKQAACFVLALGLLGCSQESTPPAQPITPVASSTSIENTATIAAVTASPQSPSSPASATPALPAAETLPEGAVQAFAGSVNALSWRAPFLLVGEALTVSVYRIEEGQTPERVQQSSAQAPGPIIGFVEAGQAIYVLWRDAEQSGVIQATLDPTGMVTWGARHVTSHRIEQAVVIGETLALIQRTGGVAVLERSTLEIAQTLWADATFITGAGFGERLYLVAQMAQMEGYELLTIDTSMWPEPLELARQSIPPTDAIAVDAQLLVMAGQGFRSSRLDENGVPEPPDQLDLGLSLDDVALFDDIAIISGDRYCDVQRFCPRVHRAVDVSSGYSPQSIDLVTVPVLPPGVNGRTAVSIDGVLLTTDSASFQLDGDPAAFRIERPGPVAGVAWDGTRLWGVNGLGSAFVYEGPLNTAPLEAVVTRLDVTCSACQLPLLTDPLGSGVVIGFWNAGLAFAPNGDLSTVDGLVADPGLWAAQVIGERLLTVANQGGRYESTEWQLVEGELTRVGSISISAAGPLTLASDQVWFVMADGELRAIQGAGDDLQVVAAEQLTADDQPFACPIAAAEGLVAVSCPSTESPTQESTVWLLGYDGGETFERVSEMNVNDAVSSLAFDQGRLWAAGRDLSLLLNGGEISLAPVLRFAVPGLEASQVTVVGDQLIITAGRDGVIAIDREPLLVP